MDQLKIIICTILCIISSSCSTKISKKNISSQISGKLLNNQVDRVYIKNARDFSYNYLDSSEVINGEFKFNISEAEMGVCYVLELRTKNNGKKAMQFATTNPNHYVAYFYIDTSHIQIIEVPFELNEISGEHLCILKAGIENRALSSLITIESFGLPTDPLLRRKAIDSLKSFASKFSISNHFLNYLYTQKANFEYTELAEIVSNLDSAVLQTPFGKNIEAYAQKISSSIKFEDIILNTPDNLTATLFPKDSMSNINLLVFWASWCGPCLKEIPVLKKLDSAWRKNGLRITSISIDDDKELWSRALREQQMSWRQLHAGKDQISKLKSQFDILAIPVSVFVDSEKRQLKRVEAFSEDMFTIYNDIIKEKIGNSGDIKN
jgi:thiol-disulfide isomerase/thioredoxin